MKETFLGVLNRATSIFLSPIFLFVIGLVVFIIYATKSKTNYLKIDRIFMDYFNTFSSGQKTNGGYYGRAPHVIVLWGVPLFFSLSLIRIGAPNQDIFNTLIVFLSIIISMYFSILSILISKQSEQHNQASNRIELLEETGTIILVQIILCIICLIFSIAMLILWNSIPNWLAIVISFLNYYFIFVMILNVLILMKRLKALIDNP